MTFSIAARDGDAWGVAVASRFLAVGSIVPAVRQGVGAVGATGAATYTGAECLAFAGGVAAGGERTAYAIQGNILTGPEVLEAMESAWLASEGQRLDQRLLATLLAGDEAGGDSRGRQSAAVLARAPGAGYDGCGILADLRVDDHPDAPRELARLHDQAVLLFGEPEDVLPLEGALLAEVAGHLQAIGHGAPDVESALEAWMSEVNLENRRSPGGIDRRVRAELRAAARPPAED